LGAALLAGIGVGVYRDVHDAYAQVHRPGVLYEPDETRNAAYREWFATFESLYPALQAVHAQLHAHA
jgi:xylulokinase